MKEAKTTQERRRREKINRALDVPGLAFKYGISGIALKEFSRILVPWGKIQDSCVDAIKRELACRLLSHDSAPNAIQGFISMLGMTLIAERLFPNELRENPGRVIAGAGLAVIGFVALGEVAQSLIRDVPLNVPDLIAGGIVGALPAALGMREWAKHLKPVPPLLKRRNRHR